MNDATTIVKSQVFSRESVVLARASAKEEEVPRQPGIIILARYGKTIRKVGNDLLRLFHGCWKNITLKGIGQI